VAIPFVLWAFLVMYVADLKCTSKLLYNGLYMNHYTVNRKGNSMADTTTLSIKTDRETKAIIQRAAKHMGLSVNSFVLMVAKNAALADEIVIRNADADELRLIESAREFNATHQASSDWDGLKERYGV
jgi:uncharacterized protein (DUF1778 family)